MVASVNVETTYNSITLTPTGTDGTNAVDHYLYSIDNGNYQESNVFNNLEENTEYTINVKAVDTGGRESNPYEINVTTDEYILPTISNVTASSTSDSITLNVTASGGTGSIVTYHYSKDDGLNYETSTSPNYTFDNLTGDVTFYIKVYVTDSNGRVSGEYSTSIATYLPTLAEYITTTAYTGTDGDNGLYYHNGSGAYINASLEAGDNSYRYAGTNPNNYICFGSDESYCQDNNLYQIIGVFGDQVKLYKKTSIGFYPWESSGTWGNNAWNTSEIKQTLNTTFYNSLSEKWQNLINETTWQIGGNTTANLANTNAKTAYNYEVGVNSLGLTDTMKIGLVYLSDYYYAADPTYWSYVGSGGFNTTTGSYNPDYALSYGYDWMHSQMEPWTLSRDSSTTDVVFCIGYEGRVYGYTPNSTYQAVNPSFYIDGSIKLVGGTGTQYDPYKLSV